MMIRRYKATTAYIGAAAVGVIGLAVWGISNIPPPVKEGTVIDRRYVPAHDEDYMQAHYRTETYTDYQTQCSGGYGSTPQTCRSVPVTRTRTVTYYLPATRHVPDDWDLRLRDCKTNDEGEEKCRTGWVDVGHDIYDRCKVGYSYTEDNPCPPR